MTTGLMQFVHGGEPLRMTLRDIHQSLRCGKKIARLRRAGGPAAASDDRNRHHSALLSPPIDR
jgi:hypothetical protein